MTLAAGSLWRHYKGGLYRVGNLAWNPEERKNYVVYSSEATGELYVRPLINWLEKVTTVEGNRVPRFTFVGD